MVVLGVSVDAGDPGVVAAFAEEQEIAYPVLLGDESLAQRYGALGYPSLYVVAPDGRIDSAHVGVVSEALKRPPALMDRRLRPSGSTTISPSVTTS